MTSIQRSTRVWRSGLDHDDVDDSYALTPVQLGMLFQASRSADGCGDGFDLEQLHVTLDESLDLGTFAAAWALAMQTHPVLGSSFSWRDGTPRQRLAAELRPELISQDWSALTAVQREQRLEQFLQTDRARGFDLALPPLWRLAVFQTEATRCELVWTFHHILLDGWSIPVVLREAFARYDALRAERAGQGAHGARDASAPASVAPEPATFRDYVVWQAQQEREPNLAFFRQLLGERAVATALPALGPAKHAARPKGYQKLTRVLDARVADALRARVERLHVGLGTAAAAAWATVLYRYTRSDVVVFGSTRDVRRSALEGTHAPAAPAQMAGLLINTLPMRVRVDDGSSIDDLLMAVREQSRALRQHEHTPLTEIAAQSPAGGSPLFETLLTFDNLELNAALAASGEPRWQRARCSLHEQPVFPLNVLVRGGPTLTVELLADRARVRSDELERLLDSLCWVLEQLADPHKLAVGELDVLPPAEHKKIVHLWNHTSVPLSARSLIHAGFEAMAAAQPDAAALELEGRSLSYRELDQAANRLAHTLRDAGVGRGSFVGVCLERSFELVTALIAVVKAGAAYVPLDPADPAARLNAMLDDVGASFVISRGTSSAMFAAERVIDLEHSPWREPSSSALEAGVRPSDTCYAIFTSGSTGRPNAALLSHRAVANTIDWVNRTFGVGPRDRLLFVTSHCFDLSVYDTFGVLAAGGTIVIADSARLRDPASLAQLLVEARITIWDSAPAALQIVLPGVPEASSATQRNHLRLVLLSGDWIAVTLPDALRAQFPAARVISLGGATEAAIWSNWFPIAAVDPSWSSIPYGRPIQNARYYALDERMRPVPIGCVGDLYIGGACVADGYANREQLNEQRFVLDTFHADGRARLYKTGDLVRYFPDGNLEFLGRSDFQVKIRGFRVELGEIETALLTLSGVRQAACTTWIDGSGEKALAAYVVADVARALDEASLRATLTERLPRFMVPTRIVFMSTLPLSNNGKVDRRALPMPQHQAAPRQLVAARTEREHELVRLWETLLRRSPIGVQDDFFEVGGHSVLALMAVAQMRAQLGYDILLPSFLEDPTIAGVLAAIDADAPEQISASSYSFHRQGNRTPIVLIGGGNYALLYRELPKLFGPDQPVHVLQPGSLREHDEALILAQCEADLAAVSANGPIVVGGFREYAWIAARLALRLEQRGRVVPLLLAFDVALPSARPRARWPKLSDVGKQARAWLRAVRTADRALLRSESASAARVQAELLLVSCANEAQTTQPAQTALRVLVAGAVSRCELPGDHMAFLVDGNHQRVIDAIYAQARTP